MTPSVSSPLPRTLGGQGRLVAGTVPVFSGQVALFRVASGLVRDPAAASLPLEVSGVTQLFGSTCSRSSRSSNLPPSAWFLLRNLARCPAVDTIWTPWRRETGAPMRRSIDREVND